MKTFTFYQPKMLDIEVYNSIMEKGLESNPNSLLLLINVFNCKLQLNAYEEADVLFSKILTHKETTSQTLYDIAMLFYQGNKNKKALSCLNKIEQEGILMPNLLLLKANCFLRLNQSEKVDKIISQLILQFPDREAVLLISAKTAYANQEFPIAIEKCNLILKKNPNNVWAYKTLIDAHYNTNQIHKIESIINYKELVKTYTLKDQVSSIENFNDGINQALQEKVHWLRQPRRFTTKKGDQLSNILNYEDEILKRLKDLFSSKILAYIKSIKTLNPGYFNVQSDILTYDMWAVRLNSEGYQEAHIHPSGWISGVYYTSLPKLNKTLNEGALEFGVYYPKPNFKALYTVQPEEGKLILFPSYYLHQTVPFESEKQRICISFDVYPYKQQS